jgi:hypothetical protein
MPPRNFNIACGECGQPLAIIQALDGQHWLCCDRCDKWLMKCDEKGDPYPDENETQPDEMHEDDLGEYPPRGNHGYYT